MMLYLSVVLCEPKGIMRSTYIQKVLKLLRLVSSINFYGFFNFVNSNQNYLKMILLQKLSWATMSYNVDIKSYSFKFENKTRSRIFYSIFTYLEMYFNRCLFYIASFISLFFVCF